MFLILTSFLTAVVVTIGILLWIALGWLGVIIGAAIAVYALCHEHIWGE